MLEWIPVNAPDTVAYRVLGEVQADEFEAMAERLEEAMERSECLNVYAEVPWFEGITLEALLKDLRFGLEHADALGDFGRIALVSHANWLQKLAKLEGALIPGIDLQTFSLDQKEEAMRWVTTGTSPG